MWHFTIHSKIHNTCNNFYWKGSSWRLEIVLRYDRFALTVSIETYKKFSQLVSTSNKRPSSGEMKKDQKRVEKCRVWDLTPILIKDDLWRLIFIPDQSSSQWGVNINLHRSSLIKIGIKSKSLYISLVDLGGARTPPTGADSFILTCKIFEM